MASLVTEEERATKSGVGVEEEEEEEEEEKEEEEVTATTVLHARITDLDRGKGRGKEKDWPDFFFFGEGHFAFLLHLLSGVRRYRRGGYKLAANESLRVLSRSK